MRVFVVHRFSARSAARKAVKKLARHLQMTLRPSLLDSSKGDMWAQDALDAIQAAEAVIIFDPEACKDSGNAAWEWAKAQEAGKLIVEIRPDGNNISAVDELRSVYDLSEEFEGCFGEGATDSFELYKLMIDSSESLIQRRQRTNAFFITVIGSLLAIAGLLVKAGAIANGSIGIVYGFSAVGLLLCNSWRNLIANYGKLNKAKFDVILRLEKEFGAQIYSAEWVALGKGMRPDKYRSFTSTEQHVPIYFGLLIVVLTLIPAIWQMWG